MVEDASSPTLWSGLDLRSGAEGGVQARRASVRSTPWAAGAQGQRYELLALASRARPSAFLSALDLSHPFTATDTSDATWHDDLLITWSLLYRKVAATAPKQVEPYAVYVLGVNPPSGLARHETDEFNDFYTNVHMPEVTARRKCLRASRYELDQVVRAPKGGGPTFLAVYELDEAAAQVRKHTGGPYSSGPEVWQRHTTPWRFWYRTLAP
jgi:hypothetical protein